MDTPPPTWMDTLAKAPDTLSYHLAHPDGSFDSYYWKHKRQLAEFVAAKKRIYLDQKYWVYFCNIETGRRSDSTPSEIYDIYEAIRSLVARGVVVCPASHLILEETAKQSDLNTRRVTTTVIDMLSGTVSLEPIQSLDRFEWFCFFQNIYARENNTTIVARDDFAWTWPSYVIDTRIPHLPEMGERKNTAFKKAHFDSLINLTFSDVLDAIGPGLSGSLLEARDFVDGIRQRNAEHRSDVTDFSRALSIEMTGAVKTYLAQGTIDEALRQDTYCRIGRWPTDEEVLESKY